MKESLSHSYVALLVKHEMLTAALYTLFSHRLPKHHAFWERLAAEEKQHAQALRDLEGWMTLNRVVLLRPKEGFPAVEESLDWLKRLIREVGQSELLSLDALEIALAVEDAMLESDYFKLFHGDCVEARRAFTALLEHTQEHRQRVEAELARFTRGPRRPARFGGPPLARKPAR